MCIRDSFKALSVFAIRDLNIIKIESRPAPRLLLKDALRNYQSNSHGRSSLKMEQTFQFMFYLDVLADLSSPEMANALRHLSELAPFIRVLGSYSIRTSTPRRPPHADSLRSDELVLPSKQTCGMKIGIIGFGNFGQFLGSHFVLAGQTVYATDLLEDQSGVAESVGVKYIHDDPETMLQLDLDVVVVSVSVLSFEAVIKQRLPLELLKGKLVVDVLSVKTHPRDTLLSSLDPECDILCTHPMFGPESGKSSWVGLPFMYEKVRIGDHHRTSRFLTLFEDKGCKMVPMPCETHDELAAGSQFVTHLTGRALSALELRATPIDTQGFKSLLCIVENTTKDSWDLFSALYQHNVEAKKQLQQLMSAFETVWHQLQSPSDQPGGGLHAISPRVAKMKASVTAQVTDKAMELKRAGVDLVSLSVGEPDFHPPEVVVEATAEAARIGKTKYTSTAGTYELRSAVSTHLRESRGLGYSPDQILVSGGAKQSIYQAMMSTCSIGDEVIVIAPYWVSYVEQARLCGATPVIIHTTAQQNWLASPEQLQAALTRESRMLVLCNPCNPTGALYSKPELEAIAQVVATHPRLLVLADEIYDQLLYQGSEHVSFGTLPGMSERTLIVNGFSKSYAMTGYRLGYLAAPLPITQACTKLQGQLSSGASSVAQHAAVAALTQTPPEFFERNMKSFASKRAYVLDQLSKATPKLTWVVPQAAFYLLVDVSSCIGLHTPAGVSIGDAVALCLYLLEHGRVAVVPGEAFGCPGTVRIAFATGMEQLEIGMSRIVSALAGLSHKSE
eukprot:TRINITY_DN56331_c0_g1_i1.p1 TRINITY_DN56331_c0_g1~~TRINITY_DN56331_c0_g1_i1.p1  ORF type:complete len:787 (-),score=200.94 TRINITY_DN56331_c0_g1_i1:297-2657(-)